MVLLHVTFPVTLLVPYSNKLESQPRHGKNIQFLVLLNAPGIEYFSHVKVDSQTYGNKVQEEYQETEYVKVPWTIKSFENLKKIMNSRL